MYVCVYVCLHACINFLLLFFCFLLGVFVCVGFFFHCLFLCLYECIGFKSNSSTNCCQRYSQRFICSQHLIYSIYCNWLLYYVNVCVYVYLHACMNALFLVFLGVIFLCVCVCVCVSVCVVVGFCFHFLFVCLY